MAAPLLMFLNNLYRADKQYSKLVMGENITQVFSFIRSGNTDLGFVALSQVIQEEKKKTTKTFRQYAINSTGCSHTQTE